MLDTMIVRGRRVMLALLGAFALAGLLGGCGGQGAGAAGSAPAGTTGTATPLVVDVFVDKPALPASDGSTTAVVTAQVKSSSNVVVSGQKVTFATEDTGVALVPVDGSTGVTDAAGRLQFMLVLGNSPAARANRTVSIGATAGATTAYASVQIRGTSVAVSGPNSLTVGSSAEYTVALVDGSGAPVSGAPVTVSFPNGTPASSSLTTGTNGQAKVTLTGTTAGSADVVATSGSLDPARLSVNVLGNDTPFRILSPSDNGEVAVDTDQAVVVQYKEAGLPVAGKSVVVATTRGTVNGGASASVATNSSGQATVTVRSASAGPGTLTATVFNGGVPSTVTSRVSFVSLTPAKISLSPDPSSIGANVAGSTSSASRLVATVRDATDNPVKGALVTFSAQDPSNGSVSPSAAVTDASGQAVASFIAGPTSTGPGAVQVTATVFNASGSAVASDTRGITVSAVALFVELGTGNLIDTVDSTTYSMPWSAIVTDANRNAVAGARVTASLDAIRFYKGIWVWSSSSSSWVTTSVDVIGAPPLACVSEDANRNNLLDAGEDTNGSGRLEPGSPAAVSVTSAGGVTGADGRATIAVVYPRSFGFWAEVTLRVTIGTPGTESTISRTFMLPVLAADITSETVVPPNVNARTPNSVSPAGAIVGPYGYVQDCASPD